MKPMMFGVYIEPSLRPVRHDSADRVLRTSVPDALAPVATVSSRVVAERDAGETRGTDVSDVDMDSSLEDLQKASAAARARYIERMDNGWRGDSRRRTAREEDPPIHVDMDSSLEDLQKASAAARRRFHARRDAAWMTPRS